MDRKRHHYALYQYHRGNIKYLNFTGKFRVMNNEAKTFSDQQLKLRFSKTVTTLTTIMNEITDQIFLTFRE